MTRNAKMAEPTIEERLEEALPDFLKVYPDPDGSGRRAPEQLRLAARIELMGGGGQREAEKLNLWRNDLFERMNGLPGARSVTARQAAEAGIAALQVSIQRQERLVAAYGSWAVVHIGTLKAVAENSEVALRGTETVQSEFLARVPWVVVYMGEAAAQAGKERHAALVGKAAKAYETARAAYQEMLSIITADRDKLRALRLRAA